MGVDWVRAALEVPMPRYSRLMIAAACLAAAGAARAEPPAIKIAWTPKPALNLADPRLSLSAPYVQKAGEAPAPGTNRTAIDGRMSRSVTGAVGYLCGLQPGPNEKGGVVSTFDPVGTFLGGQLKVSF
jgi:hypothetical protein